MAVEVVVSSSSHQMVGSSSKTVVIGSAEKWTCREGWLHLEEGSGKIVASFPAGRVESVKVTA